MLERGRDWSLPQNGGTPQGFRDYFYSSRMPRLLNGWLDIRFLDQMMVATGAGVGGGSLIYANVCVEARDDRVRQRLAVADHCRPRCGSGTAK